MFSRRLTAAVRIFLLAALTLLAGVSPISAQNYSMDARAIGMGGIGSTRNVASKLVREKRPYRRIGLPLGLLFQVLPNREVFSPDPVDDVVSDDFDLFRAMEYAAAPVNYTFGRDDSATGQRLVNDVISDRLIRDLNAYRQFAPATKLTAEGVGSPNWGKTFKLRQEEDAPADAPFHGIYVGAGPYASVTTETLTDPELVAVLSSPVPVFVPNAIFDVNHGTEFQVAAAITGGYRFSRPAEIQPDEDPRIRGLFVAADVNYLHGFRFDGIQMDIQFETNAAGLIPQTATRSTPLRLDHLYATSGKGVTIDTGVIYAVNRWDFGIGVNGIANRINWTGVEQELYVEQSLSGGDDADSSDPVPFADVTVELPINVSTNVAYHATSWTAVAEYARRFRGNNFQAGLEYLLGEIAIRGGGRYARDRWHPSAGVGFNVTPGFGIDVAVYGSSTNAERRRHASLAVSLRFSRGTDTDAEQAPVD